MERDMDLIREMLLEVEKSKSPTGCQIHIQNRTPEELCYNAKKAQEAGLIDARFLPGSSEFHILSLTYQGHEFLDAARNDTLWANAKALVLKNTGTLTVEAVKIALTTLIAKAMTG